MPKKRNIPKPTLTPKNFAVSFLAKIRHILFNPHDFFQKDIKPTIKTALIFFILLYAFNVIISSLIYIQGMFFSPGPKGVWLTPLIIIAGILGIFVWTAVVYAYYWIFGGKASYTSLFQVIAYSKAPFLLLGWIPFLEIVGYLYSIYLLVIGTKYLYDFSWVKATLLVIIPAVIAIIASAWMFTTLNPALP